MYIIQKWLVFNTTRTQNEHEPTELRNATANRPGPEEPPEAAAAKATAESKRTRTNDEATRRKEGQKETQTKQTKSANCAEDHLGIACL